jgi:hypothetical protein
LTSEGEAYLYYGITKRGWNIRFHEHTRAAVATASKRLFARTLNALIDARIAERTGRADDRPKLAGLITTICATGSLAGKRMTRRRLWSRNIASRPNIPSVST